MILQRLQIDGRLHHLLQLRQICVMCLQGFDILLLEEVAVAVILDCVQRFDEAGKTDDDLVSADYVF